MCYIVFTPSGFMRYVITLFCFLVFSFVATAQSGKEVIYKGTFTDTLTLTMRMPDHVIRDLAEKSVQSGDLPDSLVHMFDSALRKQMSFKVPTQLQSRFVVAASDTTTITLSDDVRSLGLNQTGGYKTMKIAGGRKIVAAYTSDNESMVLPPDEDRDFKPSGETRVILTYSCKEYISADGKVTVWITGALPSWINPGVRGVNIEGAILSFTIERDGGRLVSTIEKLEIIK